MIRSALVVLAATVAAAITIPDTLIGRYVLLVGVGVAALLAIFAPRSAAQQIADAEAEFATRVTAGALSPQIVVGQARFERGTRQRLDRGPYDADDPDVAHLVPAQARRRADRP